MFIRLLLQTHAVVIIFTTFTVANEHGALNWLQIIFNPIKHFRSR